MQQQRSGMERALVVELNDLRKSNVDNRFLENFEEVTMRIIRKIPHSNGSENAKRLVLTAYDHLCRKLGGVPSVDAVVARAVLQDAVIGSKTAEA